MSDERLRLDEIDLKILAILQEKGRITNAKLATEVGLSAPSMLERVKKLERLGVIKSYRAILDAKKLGRDFLIFVAVNLDVKELSKVSRFEEVLSGMPEVLECHHIAGDIDFLLKITVRDQEGYKDFVSDHLAQIPGIKRLVSWVVLSTSKDTRALLLPQINQAKI